MRRSIAIAVALLISSAPVSASASAGAAFEQTVQSAAGPLELLGTGVLRWRSVIRAYSAALYVPPYVAGQDLLADVPKRLEIEYFWAIDAADFGRAAEELLERQLPAAKIATLRERLDALHASFESVRPGDRYALTYVPMKGTELAKNGRTLAVIPGADFASAYFGMWLGEQPIDSRLRAALRGGVPERARN